MDVLLILAIYLLIVNLTGFAAMGIDKNRARRKAWRIPESTLFLLAIIGGSIGSIAGMYTFHHKTKHWYFVKGMPAIFFIQLVILSILYRQYYEIRSQDKWRFVIFTPLPNTVFWMGRTK